MGKLADLCVVPGAPGDPAILVERRVRRQPGGIVGARGLQVLHVHVGDRLGDRVRIRRLQQSRKLDLVDGVEAGGRDVVAGDIDERGRRATERRADRGHDPAHLAGLIVDRDDLAGAEDGRRRLLGWNDDVEGGMEHLDAQARRQVIARQRGVGGEQALHADRQLPGRG